MELSAFIFVLMHFREKVPEIETLLPTSVVGIVGTVMAMLAFIDTVISRVKRPADAAAKRVEEHLTGKIDDVKKDIANYARETEEQIHRLHDEIEREARECGQRATELSIRLRETEARTVDLSEKMVQSREDRRHISQSVVALSEHVTRWREEDRQREERRNEEERQREERRGNAAAARDERLFGMLTAAMGNLSNAVISMKRT